MTDLLQDPAANPQTQKNEGETSCAVDQSSSGKDTTTSTSKTTPAPQDTDNNTKKRRPICSRCHRPIPKACICEGLPPTPITLQKCHILVLQHPHETRRKNCSLPLLQLCLDPTSITVVVARRFGDQVDPAAMALLQQSSHVLLIFPAQQEEEEYLTIMDDDTAKKEKSHKTLSLSEAKEYCRTRGNTDDPNTHNKTPTTATTTLDNTSSSNKCYHDRTVVVILDATWKYAREMDKANVTTGQYPNHMRRVALSWEDPLRPAQAMVPRRFDIRTPPSEVHLSTAECIAWVVSALEGENEEGTSHENNDNDGTTSLYSNLMKPLDCMVAKWHECRRNATDNHHHNNNHPGRRKNKNKNKGRANDYRQQQQTDNVSRDYDYYANPDHAKIQEVEEEEEAHLSRASFFTRGDSDNQTRGKQKQNSKKRRR